MTNMRVHLFSVAVLGILLSVSVARGDNSKQCQRWGYIAGNSTVNEKGLNMTCKKNSSCTGIECSGIYHYSIAHYARRDVDFCFGFRFNPCYNPVTADVYLQVPDKTVSYMGRFRRSDNIQVPDLKYHIVKNLVTADVFLEVTLGAVVNSSVLFGVDLTVRADYVLGKSWPDGLKRSLVPKQHLFVRQCTSTSTSPPNLVLRHCIPKSPPTTAAPATTKALKPPVPGQPTTKPSATTTEAPTAGTTKAGAGSGKKCDEKLLYSCGPNEYCDKGVCKCVEENKDSKGGCTDYSTSAPPPTPKFVPSADKPKTKPNSTVLAISVVGGVFGILLIVVVALIVVRWRRSRARYSNHELLLNNDDDNMVM